MKGFGGFEIERVPSFLLAPLVLSLVPLVSTSPFVLSIFIIGTIYAVLATSWDLLAGYTGLLALSHAAFFMVGAYAYVFLTAPPTGYVGGPPLGAGLPPALGIPLAGFATALLGLGLGAITIRIRGTYLALATLGFSEITRIIVSQEADITRGDSGLTVKPLVEAAPQAFYFTQYYISLFFLTLWLIASYFILRSKLGYYMRAIRDEPEAAEAMGVDTVKSKLTVFAFASFAAGVAGSIYGQFISSITPSIATLDNMGIILAMTLIGGSGTITGPLIGSYLIFPSMQYLREFAGLRLIIFGLLVIIVVRLFPEGLYGALKAVGRLVGDGRYVRKVADNILQHAKPDRDSN